MNRRAAMTLSNDDDKTFQIRLLTLYLTLIALASWIIDLEAPTDDECPIGLIDPLSGTCGWAGGCALAA